MLVRSLTMRRRDRYDPGVAHATGKTSVVATVDTVRCAAALRPQLDFDDENDRRWRATETALLTLTLYPRDTVVADADTECPVQVHRSLAGCSVRRRRSHDRQTATRGRRPDRSHMRSV
ncbi:hypothetical protein Ga0074812_12532 [Parafrankia irregularis]|uniref:Uncharacterized protein n=1 Tax=Parafrankia irregularis TaxID=795642 RepID=A0A0S4QX81_9ACTN|nr:hypothetical protein ACG83_38225 [Frankia sp. R43]CUU59142.1 hypothetical protein Ga0074812_12532 [Parafrankia irregularis]